MVNKQRSESMRGNQNGRKGPLPYNQVLRVRVSEVDVKNLAALATRCKLSRSEVVRDLISKASGE